MTTTTKTTLYVIQDTTGQVDLLNDEIRQPSIYISRAHAGRVIKWLGMTGRTVREATDEEIAGGFFAAAHCVPNWSAGHAVGNATPQKYIDLMDSLGVSHH